MRIAVDLDGVIANWGKQWDRYLDDIAGAERIPRHHQQLTFDLKAGLNSDERQIVDEVMATPGFYADLDPINGAIEGLHYLAALGHDVTICTSPWIANPTCASDKLAWVRYHLGDDWAKKTIITFDKTLVRGDFLIDDKPELSGSMEPTWEHIVYAQPYNVDVIDKRRLMDWSVTEVEMMEYYMERSLELV
jgi:5'-nucleotidase